MHGLPQTYSVAQVAEATGQPESYVARKCRAGEWPHLRGSRGAVRFTAEQVARCLELMTVASAAPEAPRLSFAPRSRRRAS